MKRISLYADRMYEKRFQRGIDRASGPYHKIYNHRISGEGVTAHYYCSSQQTVAVIDNWQKYLGRPFNAGEKMRRIRDLRLDWLKFMDDPRAYVDTTMDVRF